jgi:hypothetical protein
VFVRGPQAVNRAFDGDVVAIEMLPKEGERGRCQQRQRSAFSAAVRAQGLVVCNARVQ